MRSRAVSIALQCVSVLMVSVLFPTLSVAQQAAAAGSSTALTKQAVDAAGNPVTTVTTGGTIHWVVTVPQSGSVAGGRRPPGHRPGAADLRSGQSHGGSASHRHRHGQHHPRDRHREPVGGGGAGTGAGAGHVVRHSADRRGRVCPDPVRAERVQRLSPLQWRIPHHPQVT